LNIGRQNEKPVTNGFRVLTWVAQPRNFDCIKANYVLKIEQGSWETVELVSQPEVSKSNKMEWCGNYTKLKKNQDTTTFHYTHTVTETAKCLGAQTTSKHIMMCVP
jgi:hypothetical protein